jgi:hypothetical protein
MTVALLAQWGSQPPGTLYTSDAGTEAAMVTAKVATATLTGAVAWVPPGNSPNFGKSEIILAQSAVPVFLPPSGTTVNGVYINGAQLAAGVQFNIGTPGTGRVATFSAAVLAGAASDTGRIITILDGGVYIQATITGVPTTTVATVTIAGGTFSQTGADYAQGTWQISGGAATNTAMPVIAGGAWMFFPASAALPSGAGVYWTVQSSSTVAQIYTEYNDTTTFTPYIPINPVAITSGGSTFACPTTKTNLITVTIPGNTMGPSGTLRVSWEGDHNGGAGGQKTFGLGMGAVALVNVTGTGAARVFSNIFRNRNVTNINYIVPGNGLGRTETTIDTTINQKLYLSLLDAQPFEWKCITGFTIEVLPGA